MRRRARSLAAIALAAVSFTSDAAGEEVAVPVALQAELVAKVAAYDRNLPARAAGRVHVMLVVKPKDDASNRFAKNMASALGGLADIGGLPHDETTVTYAGAAALADVCRSKHVSILYLAPGLGDEVPAIKGALEGVSVLSVAALANEVPKGVVLGFDLVSGKPKIVVHLGQARRQDVSFRADLLKLARVLE